MLLRFLGGPSIITEVLERGRERQKSSQCQSDVMWQGPVLPFLALEMEEAMSQGIASGP